MLVTFSFLLLSAWCQYSQSRHRKVHDLSAGAQNTHRSLRYPMMVLMLMGILPSL